MKQNPDDKTKLSEAEQAVEIATTFIEVLSKAGVKPEVAYAVFGNAFVRMSKGIGNNKEEWLEMATIVSNHWDDD